MINEHRLINRNSIGTPTGLNLKAIKSWILDTTPYHVDLEPYTQVHLAAKTRYFSILAEQLSSEQIIQWRNQILAATIYVERLVDTILEHEETTYLCDLRTHPKGEQCPNRAGIVLPEP